jgi:hypothetical protein
MSRTLLIGLIALTSACHTWRVESASPQALLTSASPPGRLRVRLQDSTRLVLDQPHLLGDSLAGLQRTAAGVQSSTAVPLESITEVAVRRFSTGKTVGLVAGSFAALFAVAAVGCAADGGCGGPTFNGPIFGP